MKVTSLPGKYQGGAEKKERIRERKEGKEKGKGSKKERNKERERSERE